MKFYLAREGVAFGPYTELQLRESVRLGIFESADLALAENGEEWRAIGELFPVEEVVPVGALKPGDKPSEIAPMPVISMVADDPAPMLHVDSVQWLSQRRLALAAIPLTTLCCFAAIWMTRNRDRAAPRFASSTPAQFEFRTSETAPTAQSRSTISYLQPMDLAVPDAAELVTAGASSATETLEPAMVSTAPSEPAQAAPEQNQTGSEIGRHIEGQIFIAARNGLKYEPPSVEVRLYPLNLLKPYLAKRSSEATAQFEQLKLQINDAEAEKELLRKAADAAFDACVQATASNRRALEQANADAKKAREKATNVYYELLQSRQDLLSGAFYLADLPKAVALTRTDSQGRFTFSVPIDGEFAVVAGAQRGTDNEIERYYWFVPVSVDGEPKKTVLLSNNNVSSHGSTDSLVQTAD